MLEKPVIRTIHLTPFLESENIEEIYYKEIGITLRLILSLDIAPTSFVKFSNGNRDFNPKDCHFWWRKYYFNAVWHIKNRNMKLEVFWLFRTHIDT